MNTYPYLRFPGFRLKALTLSYDDGVIYDRRDDCQDLSVLAVYEKTEKQA